MRRQGTPGFPLLKLELSREHSVRATYSRWWTIVMQAAFCTQTRRSFEDYDDLKVFCGHIRRNLQ